MRKVFTLIKIALVVLALFFSVTVATYAYYEYYGKYSNVINITGTIKLDAFDVLYPTLREDGTYGITPENPYVIDNVARLQNLIQLNNSGKLKKYKEDYYKKYGITIDKFYFCLEFDAQQIPQILDLANEGLFESIGNNDYPFEDELAGIVYGYELTSGNIVYLSGCLPKVQIKVENNLVYVNGLADPSLNAADFTNGIYLKAERLYDATSFNPSNPNSIVFDANSSTTYISIKDVTPIHQVIANEQITVPIEQIDVGFISKIASNASVHDLILYNISINCIEDVQGSTHNLLKELFALLEGHHFADTENHSDEKHIGIFAGHIDGNASDISVGGTSTINIDTPEVNYYSNYMTVGYIYDFATIGGVTFNTLQQDSFLEGGSVSGCLFADDIYASVADDAEFSTADGAKHYALVNISSNTTHGWPGVANGQFSYGSFMFLLSANDDTVTNIWNGNNAYKLLNDEGYTITGSVLFCADEYRYSPDQQAGGSIIPSSASVKEMLFNGISSLKATGSVIDAGKYLIVAKVADNSRDGGYAYYAIKLKASDDGTGNAVYTLDATSSADVTEFILDDSGTVSLYQSALWNVDVASTTPVFENCRYEDVWLNRDENGLGFGAYSGDENDHLFQYSAANNHLYYNVTTGEVTTQYYVAYDDATGEWAITSDVADAATIEMYHVADGYYVNLVTSVDDIEENGDYVIVARSGSTSYLLGIDNTDGIISDSFAHVDKEFTTASFPSLITLSEYEAMRNYVWNVQSASNGVASFVDKASLTYYLTTNDGALDLSTTSANWTYSQLANGGTLTNSNLYLNYAHNSESLTTCFGVGSSSYTIYLYRLEPVDDTPLYITYEGAKYLDADSSPIDAGTYAIIGVNGNNYYALGLNNTNNVVSTATNVNGASTLTNYFHWTVAEQTSTPTFRNEQSTGRFLNHNGTTINSATTSATWMYDSQYYRVYYKNGDTTYYLTTNNAGTFSLQTSLGVAGYSYEVRLYKCVTKHEFTGVSIATEFVDGNYYLVSYADLSDTSKSQFLVGYRNEGGSQVLDRYNFSDKYTITGTINNNSNATITTTADMMNYAWLSIENNNGTAQRPEYYYYLYNAGYYNEHGSNLYLGCSSTGGSRTLIITDVAAYRVSGVNSGISVDTTHLNSPVYSGLRIAIRGTSYYYFLTSKNIEGEFELISTQNTANFADNRYNSEVLPTYIYQATSVTNTPVLELVSSNGDSLDQNIHYMITAEDNSGAATQYYALAMEEDDENNITFKGENVTSQVEMIMGYGDAGYKGSTNVPRNADWTQKSDSYELRFYHTATSSNSEQNYISRSGANLVMDLRASTAAITDVSKFYYDIVNKVMKIDVDSTTYYLTYDSSTKQFGISTNEDDKATIHLIRYTPTYKVEVVTDYADGALKDGSFIIAGHSINGYFAIGTNGTAIDYGFNITNYLNEDLSEEDYKSILQYIFKQLYYDYHPDVSYDANVSSGYVDFQIMTLQNTGSFAPIGRTNANYETYSSAYTWRLTKTDDGLWKFVNHQTIGDTPNNSYGLTFNNGGGSSSLKLNDLVPQIDSYIGQYDISTSFTNGSNIYVYSPETGERYTQAITSGSQYLLVAEVRGLKFIIGNNNGDILVSIYDSAVLATYNTNSKYLWTISEYQEGYSLVNDGYYAYANATGTMLANNGSIDGCFIITSGAIAYRQYTYYYAYSSTNNTLAVSQGDTYWTKICRYVIDGTNCKFYPVSNSEIETYQNSLVLVSKNGANYYLLNIGGNNISRSAALSDETDYYQIALGSIILDEYKVEVIDGANEFEYSVRAANTFFVYSNNTNTLTVSTNKSYWTKICRYVLEDGYYKFYPVTSSADITTYADSLVLVSKNVSTYFLVNIGSSTISRSSALTNNSTYYQIAEGDITIDEYLVEAISGANADQYSIRARMIYHPYSSGDNTLAVSISSNYWTRVCRYVLDGTNYKLYPVETSDFSTYANNLVLVTRNNDNYYLLSIGGATPFRSAALTNNNTYYQISSNDVSIDYYLVEAVSGANAGEYSFRAKSIYHAFSSGVNTLAVSVGTNRWAKVYRYEVSGANYNLYPVTVSELSTYADQLVLVSKNDNDYYMLDIGGTSVTRSAALINNDTSLQIGTANVSIDEYLVEVNSSANAGEYSFRARKFYYAYNSGDNALSVSTNSNQWMKIYRYEASGTNYNFYPVSTSELATYANNLVLISRGADNNYYLIDIASSPVARKGPLTINGSDLHGQMSDIYIHDYTIEVSGVSDNQYRIRAAIRNKAGRNTATSMNVQTGANYWIKIFAYTGATNTNSDHTFTEITDIANYVGQRVLILRSGNNYYLVGTPNNSTTNFTLTAITYSNGNYTWSGYLNRGGNARTNYLTTVATDGNGQYSFVIGGSRYLNITNTTVNRNNGAIYLYYSNEYGVYYKSSSYNYLNVTETGANTTTTATNVAYSDDYGAHYASPYHYLNVNATQASTTTTATNVAYSDVFGAHYVGGYYYLNMNNTQANTTANASTITYSNRYGVYYAMQYYYLNANNTQANIQTGATTINYSFDNGVYYKNSYYYLTTSTTTAGRSTNSSVVRSEDGRGLHTRTTANYNTGLECDTFFSAETEEARGAMVVIFEHENGVYTQLVGDLVQGKQYIIAVKGNDNIYSFIGYDATNGVLRLTAVGSILTDFEDLVNASHLIDAYSSGNYGVSLRFHNDTTKYLSIINDNFGVSSTVNYWEYYWTGVYTDESRLYTVSSSNVSKVFTVSGNRIIPQVSGAETYLFNYEGTGTENDPYKITTAVTAALANRNYVIIIYQDSKYYVVANNDGEIVPVSSGSGFPSTISSNMIWTYNTAGYFKPMGEAGVKYLRTGRNGALTLLDNYTNSSWSYTYSASSSASFASRASSAANTTPVYLFKVSMNDSLDAISDTYTTLKGKSIVNASLSVLSSSNYIITATYNGKVYALGMKNLQESMALDITETFNEAISGGYIRIFSPSVWEQMGTDYNLIFNSLGFSGEQVNLLSGSRANVFEGSPTVVQFEDTPDDTEPYVWTLYTYGDNDYVLGNYDSGYLDTSFIYFDTEELMFKVTQNEATAKAGGSKVSIYQLGSEVRGSDAIEFQTFMIKLKEDNVTIESYPLNEIEAKDITKYSEQTLNGTIGGVIDGEYMIAAKADGRYYALTLDYSGNLQASDISLLFSGNFSTDEQGKYCISINTRYLWKQTGTVAYDQATGVVSNLSFTNYNTNTALDLDGTTLSYGNGQLYSAAKHLNFSVAGGFTLGAGNSSVEIIIYSVGAGSVVIGDDSNELSYAYYSSALNTNALDFSDFTFQKVLIPNLQKYAKDATGSLTVTEGWNLTATTYLEEVNSSVYFSNGINYSSNVSTFANEFINIEYIYDVTDDETQEVTSYTVDYYAPKGVASFVISEATLDMPTFVNVIVSTQLDGDFNSEALRYLAVWKAADLVDNELVPLETSEGGASDYAATLISKFYKPDNAIPLPNHLGSVASGASYVKVQEDEDTTAVYNLSQDANWNHLVAHTFCITSPGVYYIGSTYGTISFSYISIGNMLAAEEGEVNEEALGDGFSIDFVWGSIPSTSANVSFNDDSGVSDLTYVSRVTQNDESKTWVHSNIYPKFVNGTAGLYDEAKPEDYNPTDYLTITVNRDYTIDGNIEYSTVHINAVTNLAIHNEGNGIVYSNINNTHQRVKRKVEFHVSCVDGEVEPNGD